MKLRKRSSRERGHSAGEGQPSKRRKRGKKSTEDVWYHNVSPIFEEPISDDFLGLVATPESQERPYEEPSVQVTVERNVPVAPPEEVAPDPDAHTPAMAPEAAPDPYGAMPWADPWTEPGFPAEAAAGSLPAPPWAMEPPGEAPEMTPPPPAATPPPWADATADPSVEPQVQSGPDLAEPERLIPPEPPSEAPVWEPEPSSDPGQPFPPAHPVPQRPFVHEGGPSPVVDPPMIIPIRAYYMTRADDTLRSIAAQFLNTPSRWQELRSLNAAYPGIANAGPDTVLPIGSSIALPGDPLPWGKPDPVYLWTLAEKFLYTAWGREPSPEEVVPFWRGLTSGAKHLDMGASAPPAIDASAPPTEPPIPPAMQPPAAPPPPAAPVAPTAPPAPPAPTVAPPQQAWQEEAPPVEPPPHTYEQPAPPEQWPYEPAAYEQPAPLEQPVYEPAAYEPPAPPQPEFAPPAPPEQAPYEPVAYEQLPPPESPQPAFEEPAPPEQPRYEPEPAQPETHEPPPTSYDPPHAPEPAGEDPAPPQPSYEPPHAPEPAGEVPAPPEPPEEPRYQPPVTPAPAFEPMPGMPDLGPIEPVGRRPETEAPPLPAFMPSLTGATPSAELPVEQLVASSPRALAGTAIGDAMMLWQLGRLRRRRGVKRGDAEPDPLELSLEQTARMDSLRLIEAAMRHLRAVTIAQLKPKPRVVCVRTGAYGFEVLLDQPVEAPDGWLAAAGGYVLELPRGASVEQLDAVGRGPSLCPALVPVGDTAEGPLLLNLEEIGCLAVAGPNNPTASLLTSIVETLGSSPLAGDIRIITVGVSSPVGPGWERIHATSYDSPQLEHLLLTAHSPADAGAGSIDVLVVGPGNDLLFQRAGQIATAPGSRLVLVGATSSAAARWPWRVHVDENSRAVVHPVAVNIVATQAMRPELAYLLSEAAEGSHRSSRF